jgi:hypothetical protein
VRDSSSGVVVFSIEDVVDGCDFPMREKQKNYDGVCCTGQGYLGGHDFGDTILRIFARDGCLMLIVLV